MSEFLLWDNFHFLRPYWFLLLAPIMYCHWRLSLIHNSSGRWKKVVAPHLLPHISQVSNKRIKIRPYQLLTCSFVIGVLISSGPTWHKQITPFTEDRAPLIIALELTPSMMAVDQAPTRLERAKQKIKELLVRRQGARTALIVYAGSAHVALPLTEDVDLIHLYLDSLFPSLMPADGDDIEKTLPLAETMLVKEPVQGTMLVFTDGVTITNLSNLKRFRSSTGAQLVFWGVGSDKGGDIKDEQSFLTDQRVTGLDYTSLSILADQVEGRSVRVTLDHEDVDYVMGAVNSYLVNALDEDASLRWLDGGYPLLILLVALSLVWFRKGWTLL